MLIGYVVHAFPTADPSLAGKTTELIDLCSELKFAILAHVDTYAALTCVGATCTELRAFAADDLLWARLYETTFGDGPEAPDGPATTIPMVTAFRRRLARQKQAQQEAEMAARAARARPHPFAMPGMMPGMPHPVPGGFAGYPPDGYMPDGFMVGGDFDRMPGLGIQPPFGANPFGGGRGGMGGGLPFGGGPLYPGGPGDGFMPP